MMTEAHIHQIDQTRALVFGGIDWKTLIGRDLANRSHKEASALKATHYVAAGNHSAAVGTIQLKDEKKRKQNRKLYSAAAIFAQRHTNGAIISTYNIGDDLVYVVAAFDGVVVKGYDIVCSVREAEAYIADFRARYENSHLVGDDTDPTLYLNAKSELVPVKSSFEKIPMPLKVGVGILLLLMIADSSWTQWKQYQARKERAASVRDVIDGHAEWTKSLDKWAQGVKVDGPKGLRAAYNTLADIPMRVGGWKLAEGQCSASASGWSCSARYDRTTSSTNESFQSNLMPGWTARWDGLMSAIGVWQLPATRIPLVRKNIPPVAEMSVDYISRLQDVLPAFRKVELTPPVKIMVAEPVVQQRNFKGQVEMVKVPYPSNQAKGIEIPSIQTLKVTGPLRSLSVLPMPGQSVIKQIRFVVDERGVIPSIRDSIFTAEMVGEIYVQ